MNDSPNAIRVDAAGNAYIVGSTESHDFPTLHPIQAQNKGSTLYLTGFVTKLKPDGSGLVCSTYLGGSDGDAINDLAVDGAGNVYVTGDTGSDDFPVTPGVVHPKRDSRSASRQAAATRSPPRSTPRAPAWCIRPTSRRRATTSDCRSRWTVPAMLM